MVGWQWSGCNRVAATAHAFVCLSLGRSPGREGGATGEGDVGVIRSLTRSFCTVPSWGLKRGLMALALTLRLPYALASAVSRTKLYAYSFVRIRSTRYRAARDVVAAVRRALAIAVATNA